METIGIQCEICENTPCSLIIKADTHQKTFTKEELQEIPDYDIIGPDTLLLKYQRARIQKNWAESDKIKQIGLNMGFKLGFTKKHYEVLTNERY
jgi:hypothetical protein